MISSNDFGPTTKLKISREKKQKIMQSCGLLSDLLPFLQLKKREKHPWRSVTFSKVAGY